MSSKYVGIKAIVSHKDVGEGGHDGTVKVKRAVAKELCTSGL